MPNQSDISISTNAITTVLFLDEQGQFSFVIVFVSILTTFAHTVQACGELFCMNGGECLDDFVCICPVEYTGPECDIRISKSLCSAWMYYIRNRIQPCYVPTFVFTSTTILSHYNFDQCVYIIDAYLLIYIADTLFA